MYFGFDLINDYSPTLKPVSNNIFVPFQIEYKSIMFMLYLLANFSSTYKQSALRCAEEELSFFICSIDGVVSIHVSNVNIHAGLNLLNLFICRRLNDENLLKSK